MADVDDTTLERIGRLITSVFGFDPPVGAEHLRWQYLDNPEGRAAIGMVRAGEPGGAGEAGAAGEAGEVGEHVGNYALIPLSLEREVSGVVERVVVGVGIDLAVAPEARGSGTFRRTVEDSYRDGVAEGLDAILGVANANSAPRMAKTLGWRVVPRLPARFLVPGRPGRFQSWPIDAEVLDRLPDLVGDLPFAPGPRFAHRWTAELLRWRLARPRASYHLHVSDDAVAVSTATKVKGLPVAVLLKALPRRAAPSARPAGPLVGALARYHRTPLVIHWGVNPWFALRGATLPHRFQPSPLELVLHGLVDTFDTDGFELGAFEFLEFDAY